jgi:ASCH domain
MSKHSLTAAEDKLLMKGFDYATDANGYDSSYDDEDVLKVLAEYPNLTAVPISLKINIPVHRVIAAMVRLKTSGKFKPPVVVKFPETCSTGNEGSCVNDQTKPGSLVTILDSEGLWKIDSLKDGHAKIDLVEGDRKLPKRRRVAFHNLRILEPCSTGNDATVEEAVATTEPLTVITLWQPWATFLIKGIKIHETRSWYTSHRGKILIHAAKRKINWCEIQLNLLEEIYPDITEWDYPLGAIVGEAELVECRQCGAVRVPVSESDRLTGDWSDGRYAWEMRNIKPLLIPDVKGKQGLWKYDGGNIEPLTITDDVVLGETVETVYQWGLQFGEQLTIFDCEQSQNREQEKDISFSSKTTVKTTETIATQLLEHPATLEPGEIVESSKADNSLLCSGDTQNILLNPEIAEAIAKSKDVVLGEKPYQFQKGDRIQKLDNPKWIGEIKSITNKGAKIRTPLAYEYMADLAEYRLFSKADSEEILGESFFNIGDKVKTIDSNFSGKVFTVKTIHSTGMIGVVLDNISCSYPSMCLFHHVEKIESKPKSIPLEQPKRKRPQKGCGSGYIKVREANKKRNAAKGKDPDVYFVYYYSYSNQYGKEIKSSISVPRSKIAQVKKMVEDKEHYVKIAKFLGKSLPLSY